jgi:flagellin
MQTYSTPTTDGKDYGEDYSATINGSSATGDGKKLTIRTAMLDAEIDLTTAAGLSTATETFYITGGGADFAIGSRVDAIGLESVGIMNVAPSYLGNTDDGYLNTLKSGGTNALGGDNLYTAQRIVDSAIKDISTLRGRLGAFQKNVLETNVNSLKITLENVTASESAIRDADFAEETAALTRSQILVQANTSILSMANTMPQSVLALLG